MPVKNQPINNTHTSIATLQQIPTENTLDVASPALGCCIPQPSIATTPKRCIRAPCRRSNQQEEEKKGKSVWPHFCFLYIKTGRRRKMRRPCMSAPSQSRLRANRASPHNLAEPLLRGRYSCYSNYIELLPLARSHYGPDMVYNRFVDDAISSLTPIQFLTLFQPHFQQAGMRFIHSPRASDGGVPFLESTFYSSAKGTHATHYSKRYHLFPNSIDLSHRGSATPQSNQIARIKAEAIRLYRVTSTVEAYANALLNLQFRNRAYPLRLFQSSFLYTLTHCHTTNKYGILSPQLHHAYLAIGQGKLLKLPK